MRINKKKIIIALITVLAAVNLVAIVACPDKVLGAIGVNKEEDVLLNVSNSGDGEASITLENDKRTFNGNGIFNPLEGVKATDIEGEDITDKVAVSYLSEEVINKKKIRYAVYDSESNLMETECELKLEDYKGPEITISAVKKISFNELETLVSNLTKNGALKGTDGFGNDISPSIGYYYEIDRERNQAEITFSLINNFQDYVSKKLIVTVTDIPDDYME